MKPSITREAWDAAETMLQSMPPAAASYLSGEAAKMASPNEVDLRRWWRMVWYALDDIYAARISGFEPVPPSL